MDKQSGKLKEVFLQTELGEKIQVLYAQEAFLPPVRFGEARSLELLDGYGYLLDRMGSKPFPQNHHYPPIHNR